MRRTLASLVLLLSTLFAADLFVVSAADPAAESEGFPVFGQSSHEARLTGGPPVGVRTYGTLPLRPEEDLPDRSRGPVEPSPGGGDGSPTTARGDRRLAARPEGASIAALPPAKLSSGRPVAFFGVSPDGATAVWVETAAGIQELFSRPVDLSAPAVQLTLGVFTAGDVGVSGFQITTDSSTVVFSGDFVASGGVDSLAAVPIGGGAFGLLNDAGLDEPVTGFGISPDGSTVDYFGIDSLHASGSVEAYSSPIPNGPPTQLTSVGLATGGVANVVFLDFMPNSATLIYAADISGPNIFDLFSVPTGGGAVSQLSFALGTVTFVSLGPTRVAYVSDDDTLGVREVYSVLTDGTGNIRLNSAMAGDAVDLLVSPGGTRVSYRADQDTVGVIEGYVAAIDTAGSSVKLHANLVAPQETGSVNLTPDDLCAVYRADEIDVGVTELFARPVDLGAPSTLLHDSTSGENVGFFTGSGVPILNRRALYPVFGATVDLFAVATDGTEPFAQLNDPLAAGDALKNGYIPFAQTARLMAYGGGPSANAVTDKIYSTPIRKDLPSEQLNVTAGAADMGVQNYVINTSETHAIYTQDQSVSGTIELYSTELDSDADGTGNAADNCKFVSNPGGTPVAFTQSINAADKTTFAWTDRDEVRYAQGALPVGATYTTTATGSLADANAFEDSSTPSSGAGSWLLIAADCSARTWGGAARDLALP